MPKNLDLKVSILAPDPRSKYQAIELSLSVIVDRYRLGFAVYVHGFTYVVELTVSCCIVGTPVNFEYGW